MKFCQRTITHALWRRIWPRWREMSGRGITDHSVKRTMRVNQKVWRSRLYCKSGDDQLRRITCAIQACSWMETLWPTRQCVTLTFTLSGNWNVWAIATKGRVQLWGKKPCRSDFVGIAMVHLLLTHVIFCKLYYRNAIMKNLENSDSSESGNCGIFLSLHVIR